VVRFFAAVAGSAMIANSPGTIADISDDSSRAICFSIWSIGPMNGPVLGPVIGGFVTEFKGWRWANWVVMIASGFALIFLLLIPETYEPAILRRRTQKKRKDEDDERYWSRYDNKLAFISLMKTNLSRPFIMAATEPICMFW
jgi:MFS family permease